VDRYDVLPLVLDLFITALSAMGGSVVYNPKDPRGSERYRELHALRSAAERTNSTLKEDNAILREPPVRSLRRAAVVSQMGVITTLMERVTRFILDITIKERKLNATGDKHWFDQLSPPEIPTHLQPFVKAS
jgi:hypothetical protein